MKSDNSIETILIIGTYEFKKVIGHPLVALTAIIILILAILNGAGFSHNYLSIDEKIDVGKDVFLLHGMGQIFYNLSLYSTILAVFMGVLVIGDERFKRSLSVILSKPLYRRDIVLGKFLGISAFLLLFIIIEFTVSSLLIMIFFREPYSMQEFILRAFSNVLALFFECSLNLVITMLFGLILKDLLMALIATITFLYVDWFGNITLPLISPQHFYFTIISGNSAIMLLDTSFPYSDWLGAALPFIIFIILEIIVILLINCSIFSKSEEL